MNEQAGTFEIRSEARGAHWVAWVTRAGERTPHRSVLLVGATRQEAEDKARKWAAGLSGQATRTPASS